MAFSASNLFCSLVQIFPNEEKKKHFFMLLNIMKIESITSLLLDDFYDPSAKINGLRLYVEKLCEHLRLLKPKETYSLKN